MGKQSLQYLIKQFNAKNKKGLYVDKTTIKNYCYQYLKNSLKTEFWARKGKMDNPWVKKGIEKTPTCNGLMIKSLCLNLGTQLKQN